MTMTDEQADLLARALLHIRKNPDEHDQARWMEVRHCGTAGCLAGHGIVLSGEFEVVPERALEDKYDSDAVDMLVRRRGSSGPLTPLPLVALMLGAEVFGLRLDEAERLFFSDNTLGLLHGLAELYSDGRVPVPDEVVLTPRDSRLVHEARAARAFR